jgi:hypothetical protein
MTKYLVRQYRPNFFSGFEDAVATGLAYDEITSAPWFENFRRNGFTEFKIEPYTDDELIVVAHYADGKFYVAGFATKEGSKMARDWRYKPHIC